VRPFKIVLVSNQDPTDQEFRQYLQARKQANQKPLTLESVKLKQREIKDFENMSHNQELVERVVKEKFRKKMREGKLGGFNLSFVKIELLNDLEQSRQELRKAAKEPDRHALLRHIEEVERNLAQVQEQLQKENLKHGNFLRVDADKERYEKLEEMEKQMEVEEWLKQQEYMARHPETKKQTFFMKLARQDSQNMTEQERQRLEMQQELTLIRMRSQQALDQSRHESYFQLTERRKKNMLELHENMVLSKESKLENAFNEELD